MESHDVVSLQQKCKKKPQMLKLTWIAADDLESHSDKTSMPSVPLKCVLANRILPRGGLAMTSDKIYKECCPHLQVHPITLKGHYWKGQHGYLENGSAAILAEGQKCYCGHIEGQKRSVAYLERGCQYCDRKHKQNKQAVLTK